MMPDEFEFDPSHPPPFKWLLGPTGRPMADPVTQRNPMKLTASDRQTAAAYEAAEPKFGGTLHERMKFLVKLIQDASLESAGPTELAIAVAIYDLEAEVMYHVARRQVGRNEETSE